MIKSATPFGRFQLCRFNYANFQCTIEDNHRCVNLRFYSLHNELYIFSLVHAVLNLQSVGVVIWTEETKKKEVTHR